MERSLRNVLVVSFGFLLLFTAYGGLQNLQSSLYSEDGMGVAKLGTLYGAVLLSSMFLPPILIKRCGCKWTIVGSMCCYVAFSLGNFYASWTSLPSRRLPLFLLTSNADLFLGSVHGPQLPLHPTGSMAPLSRPSVPVLHVSPDSAARSLSRGCAMQTLDTDCAPTNSTHRPSQELIYTLLGIYTAIGVLAILLTAVFLEATEDSESQNEAETKPPRLGSTLLSTFKLFRDKRLCLLTLLPMYSGLQQGFLSGEYTRVFTPPPLAALFGTLFERNKKAAFASYRMWEALGFVAAFGYSSFLCVSVKLYILLGVLAVAMVSYGTVEYLESRSPVKTLTATQTSQAVEEETGTAM
uniref:protein unc-93 homolog A-like n=1 Tax=Callospermophilus lateralis TaxID=76772 RepID=UPI004038E755